MKSFSWSLDTVGFFAPTHSAMRVVLDRLSTNEPRACRTGVTRLALCRTPFWEQAHVDMQEAVDAAGLASQEMLGWQVSDITLEASIWASFSAQLTIQAYEAARCLSGELEMVPDLLSDALKAELCRGLSIEGLDYAKAQLVAREARRRIADLFENYDAILTPSAAGPAPLGLDSTGSPDFNRLWTLLGLPCANVPGFFAKSGLPVGVQLVGPFRQDNGLLQIASDLEEQINLASAERSKQI
jgi:amidase